MRNLDNKIKNHFKDESVYKSPDIYEVFSGRSLPSFIKDWLIKKFTHSGEVDLDSLISFMNSHLPQDKKFIKTKLRTYRERVTILTRFIVETDIREDLVKFSIPDLGIKTNEGVIPDFVAKKHNELKDGEIWGVITLDYIPPEGSDKGKIELVDFKPFKPYEVNIEYFKQARKQFNLEEWIDLLIRSMEYNPHYKNKNNGFNTIKKKLLFLSRLSIFIEPNLNLIELAPKGTGKSYVFSNLSKYGWIFSGGIVSRAKLFFDISRKTPGIIENYDFVTFDEISTIKFSDNNEMKGALKNYLESGKFTVANYNGVSTSGLMLLGNLPVNENYEPIYNDYFLKLPDFFHHAALLDRFHGFIKGWKLIRINEDLKVRGYTLNVEYFSEILHKLRGSSEYSRVVNELLKIPKGADTRDTNAIKKLCSSYLKLLFPHVSSPEEIDNDTFYNYCLLPSLEKRSIIRKQLNNLDKSYDPNLPDIGIR